MQRWTAILVVGLVAATVPPGATQSAEEQTSAALECAGTDRTLHPPIEISEETGPNGFVLGHDPTTGEPIYRPGSGVVDGQGTAEDPYVIADWCIPLAIDPLGMEQTPADGISIHRTDAHVEIRNVTITGVGPTSSTWGDQGIHVKYASHVTITSSTLQQLFFIGILVDESENVHITDTTVQDVAIRGIDLIHSENVHIEDSHVAQIQHGHGIGFRTSSQSKLEATTVTHAAQGVQVTPGSERTRIENNRLADNVGPGLELRSSNANTVRANTITGNGQGITVSPSPDRLETEGPNAVTQNNIHDNEGPELEVTDLDAPLEATDNWWGAANGPSGGVEDACTGTMASGDGATIEVSNAEVCFDPWRSKPPPGS